MGYVTYITAEKQDFYLYLMRQTYYAGNFSKQGWMGIDDKSLISSPGIMGDLTEQQIKDFAKLFCKEKYWATNILTLNELTLLDYTIAF